jgi:hypothetical protein
LFRDTGQPPRQTSVANAQPLEIAGGPLHEADLQSAGCFAFVMPQSRFEALKTNRQFPDVLIFTNPDTHCGFPDPLSVLTRNFYAEGGLGDPVFEQISDGRIRGEKLTTDLYVWSNEWRGKQKGTLYFNAGSKHYAARSALLGSERRVRATGGPSPGLRRRALAASGDLIAAM